MSEPIIFFVGTYADLASAQEDLDAVDALHAVRAIGFYDAAIISRDADGKLKFEKAERKKRHWTRGGLLIGAMAGVFVPAVVAGAAVGAGVGALISRFNKNLTSHDLKEVGKLVDQGQVVLLVTTQHEARGALWSAMVRATHAVHGMVESDRELEEQLEAAAKELVEQGETADV